MQHKKELAKAIILLGCSNLQLPLLAWAKDIGFKIIIFDQNSHCPGKNIADHFFNFSCTNIGAIIDVVKVLQKTYSIKSSYCGSDFGLYAVHQINKFLNVECLNLDVVSNSLDKSLSKEILNSAGINTPWGIILEENYSVDYKKLIFPIIVKPVDGSGSKGVTYVNDKSFLQKAIDTAKEISPKIMIERVIEGKHIDVSGFFAEGKFFQGGQLERFFSPLPLRYPISGVQPPRIKHETLTFIYQTLEKSARALGITWGPVKADIILSNDVPYVLEVTPRFHGDVSTSFVCQYAYGVSPVKAWFRYLYENDLSLNNIYENTDSVTCWAGIFAPRSGIIDDVIVDESLYDIPYFKNIVLRKQKGDFVESIRDNRAVVGFIFFNGNSYSKIERSIKLALQKIIISIK